ncbi:MAG: threonylcarbamoyl-AMP synthase [Candidatus Omnitrophica bacterium]|nr:threonylcarbamoyl-AMP synthase [Candidatus Omnitrophota bacterium]
MSLLFRRVRILKINPDNPEKAAIALASEVLKDGGLVAFPTETVYGLGADSLNKKAIERLYTVKKRPKDKPLTVHISRIEALKEMDVELCPLAEKLTRRFWPGPLTLILNSKKGKKIGFRMPSNRIALSLIEASGTPIVAPSANLSGGKAPKDAKAVMRDLGHNIDMILDGGQTDVGIESTVVDMTVFPCRILREGAVSKSQIKDAWHHEEE